MAHTEGVSYKVTGTYRSYTVSPEQYEKHREAILCAADNADVTVQFLNLAGDWIDILYPSDVLWLLSAEYRVKPKAKILRYRVALCKDAEENRYFTLVDDEGHAWTTEDDDLFVRWLTDWVEYEV